MSDDTHLQTEQPSNNSDLHRLADTANLLVWETDENDNFVYLNPAAMAGLPAQRELNVSAWIEMVHPADVVQTLALLKEAKRLKKEFQVEYRILRSDGQARWVLTTGAPRLQGGQLRGFVGAIVDISGYRQAILLQQTDKAELTKRAERFRSLTSLSSDWFWETDVTGRFTFVSDGLQQWLGIAPNDILGKSQPEVVYDPCEPGLLECLAKMEKLEPFKDVVQSWLAKPGDDLRHISVSGEPVLESGVYSGYRGISRDITSRVQSEANLRKLAMYDDLTELPNRTLLNQDLKNLLEDKRSGNQHAVFFVDLDRFKEVNDTLGHEAGDFLLKEVARRLKKVSRAKDLVARLGGDEFILVCECPQGIASAEILAAKLCRCVAEPIDFNGTELRTGASIGISMHPSDGNTKEQLFRKADKALYQVKASGGSSFQFFEEHMLNNANNKKSSLIA